MRRVLAILALASLIFGTVLPASAGGDWDAANEAYRAGKYDQAKAGYLRLVDAGQFSADLFYNLGNAWFKLGERGRAILNYERALLLNPRLQEAESNLHSVLKLVGNDDVPTLHDKAGTYADEIVIVTSIAFWIFAFALFFLFVAGRRVVKYSRYVCVAAGILCVAGVIAILWVGDGPKSANRALVIDTEADLKYGPAISARALENLQTGNAVEILSERGEWTFCRASTGTIGWILSQKIERLRP